jgi:capsular exopolysaccharide synthesis family protein
VQSNRELYNVFMTRAKEADVSGDVRTAVARVVDAALPPGAPVEPNKSRMVLMGLLAGLLLGAGGAVLLDRLDNTIKGSESAEAKLKQPVLTVLPLLDGDPNSQRWAKMFMDDPSSHHSEAIRTARTGVLLSNVDEPNRILMVTSSVPAEGKTTLATNLGLALAQTKRTMLIDIDLRRPQLGERLGLPPNAKGLSNLVTGTATLKECVHQVPNSHLLVMPAGELPPNPLDLLVSQRFKDVLKHLQSQLDFIVLDSPPVELVSDALAVAPMAHGTIYVVKAMETPYPLARKGITRLERSGAKLLGVVVNGLDFEHAQRYYGEQVIGGYHAYYGDRSAYHPRAASTATQAPA